ncbi:MFS transporter [Celerinatantimonas diazotrophica]|uniref:Sugar phosphate permease n=1 Tax=Celerinatantimonas diazotrophica TaxID=412034 RepID=A0A4R1K4Z3_9GAMM|nr:sugar phosphate permease [Celerinatantimonas diazotrophica]CAG9297445.1 putative sulfoacetate transporter SauU [Celerinatantimonas diazotrophica]
MIMPSKQAPPSGVATNFRWIVVAMLAAIILINYIDRSAISYAIGPMSKELNLSDAQQGMILGAFGIGYAVTTLLGGILVDRFGARIVLAVSVIAWAAATAFVGVASSFIMILVARAALGLAEGPMFPGQTGAIANWLSGRERGRALGYSLVAVPISLAIGAPIVSYLTAITGWREMFVLLGAISLLWMPLWWILFRNHPKDSNRVNEAEIEIIADQETHDRDPKTPVVERGPTSWGRLLTNGTLLANYWAFFVFGYFLFFFMSWLPGYLEQTFKLSITSVGWFSIAPWLAAAVALVLLSNLSDTLLRLTGKLRIARSYLIAATQALAALVILPVAFTNNLTLALILITIAVASSMSANAAFYAVNIDVARDRSATALGIMDFGFAISGFLAPSLTGWIVGKSGGFAEAFMLMSALAASSVIVTLLFHRPDKA